MHTTQQLLALIAAAPALAAQSPQPSLGGALRAPTTATAGGTVEINVASASSSVFVTHGNDEIECIPVPGNKTVTIPVPETPGAVITVTLGRGHIRDTAQITIVSP